MVKSLSEYISETSQSYEPTRQFLQGQIDSLDSKLAKTKEDINNQYALQRNQLQNSANQAAESASLTAAGNGGSFGGAANIANKKYYQQVYTPALTSSNNNLNSALSQAESDKQSSYDSLAQQLAALQTQANTYGTQRYDAALQAEQEAALQREQIAAQTAAQNAYNQYLAQALAQQNQTDEWDFGNGYAVYNDGYGNAIYTKNGTRISAGDFLGGTSGNKNKWNLFSDIWNSGVSTSGLGNDTIKAFEMYSPTSSSSKYGYLFS